MVGNIEQNIYVVIFEFSGILLFIGGIWGLITWKRDSYSPKALKMGLRASIIMTVLGAYLCIMLAIRLIRWFG